MLTALATACLYAACFGFYEANSARATISVVRSSTRARRAVLFASWALAIVSLFVLSSIHGWERGVPTWLGVFTLVGGLSLLVSAIAPKRHVATAIIAIAVAGLSAAGALMGGAL